MPDIGDFIRRSRRSAKIAIASPGTPGDFRRFRRSAYKIARCVAGLSLGNGIRILLVGGRGDGSGKKRPEVREEGKEVTTPTY